MSVSLEQAIAAIERVAPPELAAEWDNVGLLVEPSVRRDVGRVLLTIDLTGPVLDEAIRIGADLVVAYHPAVFRPLPHVTARDPASAVVVRVLEAGLAVVSPHTALDAVPGGVNDWLAGLLGPGEVEVLEPWIDPGTGRPRPGAGQGRRVRLATPAPLDELLDRVRQGLGVERLRVARAAAHAGGAPVRTVALAPGAAGSVLRGVAADVWLTGEMRHHDVLAGLASGTSIVLGEHSNTERGYLPRLRERLLAELPPQAAEVVVSRVDADPLRVE